VQATGGSTIRRMRFERWVTDTTHTHTHTHTQRRIDNNFAMYEQEYYYLRILNINRLVNVFPGANKPPLHIRTHQAIMLN